MAPAHVSRFLVRSNGDEFRMAQQAVARPFHERHLGDDPRLDPPKRRHVLRCNALAPMARFAAWEVCKGTTILHRGFEQREQARCSAARARGVGPPRMALGRRTSASRRIPRRRHHTDGSARVISFPTASGCSQTRRIHIAGNAGAVARMRAARRSGLCAHTEGTAMGPRFGRQPWGCRSIAWSVRLNRRFRRSVGVPMILW